MPRTSHLPMMRRIPFFMISSALLISCLFAGSIPAHAGQAEGTGTVWFFRDVDASTLDPTLFKIVPSFAERLAMLRPDSYFALELPAGVHRFSWTAATAKGETLGVLVAAGQHVYIKVRFRGMENVEEREAARRMRTMQPIARPLAFDVRVSLRAFLPIAPSEPRREIPILDVHAFDLIASGSEAESESESITP